MKCKPFRAHLADQREEKQNTHLAFAVPHDREEELSFVLRFPFSNRLSSQRSVFIKYGRQYGVVAGDHHTEIR